MDEEDTDLIGSLLEEEDEFLPKDYVVPVTGGNYMKFKQGENRFRILASPIIGTETWVDDPDGKRRPVRYRPGQTIPQEEIGKDGIKHFWAMPVYNYGDSQIQILEITQKGLMEDLKSLSKSSDWGSPLKYDITVARTGEGLETRYTLVPIPPKPVDPKITKMFTDMYLNIEALYDGGDPFTESK